MQSVGEKIVQLSQADDEPLWPPAFGAWIKIGVVYQRTHRHLAALLRPLDLTVPQFDALANLYVGDGISQQELARRMLVTKGNVSSLVDKLTERGLTKRETDPSDRRANRVRLTRSGRNLAKRALVVQRDLVADMMGALSPKEQERLRKLLTRVVAQLEEGDPKHG